MKDRARKILAVVVVLITICGWFVLLKGIPGVTGPIVDKINRGLDIEGGVYVVLEAQDTEGLSEEELNDTMERTQAVVENRVDAMGLANPNVTIENGNRIRVELPGVEDAEEAAEMIGKTAQLQFLFADGGYIMDGDQVEDASVTTDSDSGGYVVELQFNDEGAEAFEAATEKTAAGGVTATLKVDDETTVADNSIVIMLDNEIISYPTAEKVISGDSCVIEGDFSEEEATELAALIRGGSLPTELQEISSSSQTATIGIDAFQKSVVAGIIGILLIFLLMIYGYRLIGAVADMALALYVAITLAIMAAAGSVLTLPGIAGLILSIGMAVDANVIIFARIREEILNGKSIRVATRDGYKRALTTVIDSQVTTLIATIILYQLGTSAVKGFAWTLMIGIIVSIFTAVFITQIFLNIIANSKRFAKPGCFGIKKNGRPTLSFKRKFKFIERKKIFYGISIGIFVFAIVVGVIRGGFNYGIDFTGGTMIHVDMGKQVSAEEVKSVAKNYDINTKQMSIVFSGDNNEEAIIRTNESLDKDERAAFIDGLEQEFGFEDGDVLESQHFGPSVGNELKKNALLSMGIAAIGMLIYIRIRFRQWRYGAAAVLGVLHDVLILMSFYVIFGITVNNPFIAALLTIVGYSINDTIVIFDRVRENSRFAKRENTKEMLDASINQTLTRSLMTSFTTLIVMIPLVIYAGSTIREFVLPLMVGIIAGAYSSIAICSPLYYDLSSSKRKSKYQKHVEKSKKNDIFADARAKKKAAKLKAKEEKELEERKLLQEGEDQSEGLASEPENTASDGLATANDAADAPDDSDGKDTYEESQSDISNSEKDEKAAHDKDDKSGKSSDKADVVTGKGAKGKKKLSKRERSRQKENK